MRKPRKQNQSGDTGSPGDWPSTLGYWPAAGGALLIAVLVLVAYQPAFHGGFIWDDELYLTKCDLIKAPDGLYRFWFTTQPIDYWPVSNSTLWLEWRLWGMSPTGYHITNLLLHIGTALLIWRILRKLFIPGAFLAALLFAVHPVNVESVAWIAQRKGLLAMLFLLLSILCYVREEEAADRTDDQKKSRGAKKGSGVPGYWYWGSLLAFLLAMLSKGSAAVLPPVLLLVVWWQRQRLNLRDIRRTIPFFLVAVGLTGVNIWFQLHGSGEVIRTASFAQRLIGAGGVIWFYLCKALAPIDLIFVYPHWALQTTDLLWWLPLLAVLAATVVLWQGLYVPRPNWNRPLLFAWLFFCMTLVPVLGFTDVYFMKYSLVADHYQYISLVSVAALVGAGWYAWRQRFRTTGRAVANVLAAVVVGLFVLLTRQQSAAYQDAITLYQATIYKNPACWLAYTNLGNELLATGRLSEALENYRQVLRIQPEVATNYYNLANALKQAGQLPEAIEQYRKALRINEEIPGVHNNLALALAGSDQVPEAIEHYQRALQLKPDYPEAHYNLANALIQAGELKDAEDHYIQALRLKPDFAEAHNNLGNLLFTGGKFQKALEHYQRAVQIRPAYADAQFNLAKINAQLHNSAEAVAAAHTALELARAKGQTGLVQQIEGWLTQYHAEPAPSSGTPPNAKYSPAPR